MENPNLDYNILSKAGIVIHDPANKRNLVVDETKGGCQQMSDVEIVRIPDEEIKLSHRVIIEQIEVSGKDLLL